SAPAEHLVWSPSRGHVSRSFNARRGGRAYARSAQKFTRVVLTLEPTRTKVKTVEWARRRVSPICRIWPRILGNRFCSPNPEGFRVALFHHERRLLLF